MAHFVPDRGRFACGTRPTSTRGSSRGNNPLGDRPCAGDAVQGLSCHARAGSPAGVVCSVVSMMDTVRLCVGGLMAVAMAAVTGDRFVQMLHVMDELDVLVHVRPPGLNARVLVHFR